MTRDELKEEVNLLIDRMPKDSSWDDLMYRIYVRQKIERGLEDNESAGVYTSTDIRNNFGIKE